MTSRRGGPTATAATAPCHDPAAAAATAAIVESVATAAGGGGGGGKAGAVAKTHTAPATDGTRTRESRGIAAADGDGGANAVTARLGADEKRKRVAMPTAAGINKRDYGRRVREEEGGRAHHDGGGCASARRRPQRGRLTLSVGLKAAEGDVRPAPCILPPPPAAEAAGSAAGSEAAHGGRGGRAATARGGSGIIPP